MILDWKNPDDFWLKWEASTEADKIDYPLMRSYPFIVIDGATGAGKTRIIAPNIANEIGAEAIIHFDEYVIEVNGPSPPYTEHFNYEKLCRDIMDRSRSPGIIMEGVFMIKILDRIKVNQYYLIFVEFFENGRRKSDKPNPSQL